MESLWTETQVRFIVLGIFQRMPDVAQGISVEQSVRYLIGNQPTISRQFICSELGYTEAECTALMIQGGWDVEN